MRDEKRGMIYRTKNYDQFKRLPGNRSVTNTRVNKIVKSIESVGYILSPILVNERFEVIDGQGRLEALKKLSLPVDYMVCDGLGIEECVAMNIYQTGWSMLDHIKSHEETGNISYMYLSQLIKTFNKKLQLKVIVSAITGKSEMPNGELKAGTFVCTQEQYETATRSLSYLLQFKDIIDRIGGRTECYYMALIFCWGDDAIDNDRLVKKMRQLQANFIPVINIQQAFDYIEDAYNNRSRDKVYIKTRYKQYLDDRYNWYLSRYGNKY